MPDVVTVYCRMANGVTLRLFKAGYGDGTGIGHYPVVPNGPGVTLLGPNAIGAGVNDQALHRGQDAMPNEVDRSFWNEWMKQNALNPLYTKGALFAFDPGAEA